MEIFYFLLCNWGHLRISWSADWPFATGLIHGDIQAQPVPASPTLNVWIFLLKRWGWWWKIITVNIFIWGWWCWFWWWWWWWCWFWCWCIRSEFFAKRVGSVKFVHCIIRTFLHLLRSSAALFIKPFCNRFKKLLSWKLTKLFAYFVHSKFFGESLVFVDRRPTFPQPTDSTVVLT